MSSESSLTAFDPEVVAPAERAAETGCSEASSASLVSSIEVGPGIEFSAGDAAHGVLPLVAERTPSLELPVWACGVSRWTPSLGDLIIPFIFYLFHETDVAARKPRAEYTRGLTIVGEAWDYMGNLTEVVYSISFVY